MGETKNRPFQFSFSTFLKVDFQGSRVTSDASLLLVRELDERLGLSQLISDNLIDEEYATASAGFVAPVDLQPPDGL